MLDFQIFRIRKVLDLEKPFHLGNTLLRKVNHLILFIYNKVAAFLLLHTHDGIQLGQVFHIRAPFHLFGKDIAGFVKLRGLPALPRNDQRRTRLVNQDGVNLIDDGIMQITKHQLLLVNDHVIP